MHMHVHAHTNTHKTRKRKRAHIHVQRTTPHLAPCSPLDLLIPALRYAPYRWRVMATRGGGVTTFRGTGRVLIRVQGGWRGICFLRCPFLQQIPAKQKNGGLGRQ